MKKVILFMSVCLMSINYSLGIADIDTVTIELEYDLPKIKWSTNSQINSDYFIVERSFDSLNWVSIGYEQAAGTTWTLLQYEMVDTNFIPTGDIVYYRVCDISYDGTKACYLPVVFFDLTQLSLNVNNKSPFKFSVYPNPTSDFLYVDYSSSNSSFENHEIIIHDITGKIIVKERLENNQKLTTISVKEIISGVYFCSLYADNKFVDKVKFVVNH